MEPTESTRPRPGWRRIPPSKVRRAGWNVADQALSALTNVVLSFIVARNVDADGFGAFSVAFLVFSLLIGAERSLVGGPLSMRHSHEDRALQHLTVRPALGTSLAMALVVSLGSLVAGLAIGGVLGPTLIALAAVLPFLILQDTARMAFFAWARPRDATINDAAWAVVQFGLVAVVVAADRATPATMVLCWGAGAAVASVVGMVQLRGWPTICGVGDWIRRHRDLMGFLMLEYLVGVGAFQGGLLLIGGALGVSDIGALRAAQVLIGPIGILSTAAMSFGVPEVARRTCLPGATMRIAAAASGVLVAVTALYSAVILLIPDSLGEALLGDTWTGASAVLLPVALGSVVAGGKLGPAIFTYGLGLARKTIRLVSLLAVLAVVFMAIGAQLAQATGLAWGLALAQAVVMPWWFLLLRQAVRSGAKPAGAVALDAPGAAVDLPETGPDLLGLGSAEEWPADWQDGGREVTGEASRGETPT